VAHPRRLRAPARADRPHNQAAYGLEEIAAARRFLDTGEPARFLRAAKAIFMDSFAAMSGGAR